MGVIEIPEVAKGAELVRGLDVWIDVELILAVLVVSCMRNYRQEWQHQPQAEHDQRNGARVISGY